MLIVEDLKVGFSTATGVVDAVHGVNFSVGRDKLGIVGESGSGKTMTGRALMRLVPPPGQIAARRMSLDGIDLLRSSEREMRAVRGRRIAMVMQDARYALNPVMPVGSQIAEVSRTHIGADAKQAQHRALEMLEAVRVRDPERVHRAYSHELSGGMGQRVMIAMMLCAEPDLLIADEPTSSLDATTRVQVLAILDELVSRRGMGVIFISHDLNLVASFCDRVSIMFAGRIVENCAASELHQATHPYSRGLLAAAPRIHNHQSRLPVMVRDPNWGAAPDGAP